MNKPQFMALVNFSGNLAIITTVLGGGVKVFRGVKEIKSKQRRP
jgi:hypothetical protein